MLCAAPEPRSGARRPRCSRWLDDGFPLSSQGPASGSFLACFLVWRFASLRFPAGNAECSLKGATVVDRRSPPRPLRPPVCTATHRLIASSCSYGGETGTALGAWIPHPLLRGGQVRRSDATGPHGESSTESPCPREQRGRRAPERAPEVPLHTHAAADHHVRCSRWKERPGLLPRSLRRRGAFSPAFLSGAARLSAAFGTRRSAG